MVPEAWKAFGDRIVTTDEFFEQEDLPSSMAVIGLGVIGLELGQSLCRWGWMSSASTWRNNRRISDPEVNKEAVTIIGKEFPMWLVPQPKSVRSKRPAACHCR